MVKKHELGDYLNPDQATLDYNARKQQLVINDLKRYGIKSLIIESYSEITALLKEIESRFKKRTIFISGSAEIFDPYNRNEAISFIHTISKNLIENDFRIVNGFGWGIGSSVINGALEAIYEKPLKYSETQLILRPFPQFESGKTKLAELWEEYRQKMVFLAGISIFVFGNKPDNGKIIDANGVLREFEISSSLGNICIPIGCTGYASKVIYEKIIYDVENYYKNPKIAKEYLEKLNDTKTPLIAKSKILIDFIKTLTS